MIREGVKYQVVQEITSAYKFVKDYSPRGDDNLLRGEVPDWFIDVRKRDVGKLVMSMGHSKDEQAKAFLSEWLTYLSLRRYLQGTGFAPNLAPSNLENGSEGLSGIDLVISEEAKENLDVPMLGINVKLRAIKPRRIAEHHRYDPRICAPSINLSLGDWEIKTREKDGSGVRDWIDDLVIGKIAGSGKIPYFFTFGSYLIGRVSETLDHYLSKTRGFKNGEYVPSFQESNLFPKSPEEFGIFYNKLEISNRLFSELFQKDPISLNP